jgi:hypothetical protein
MENNKEIDEIINKLRNLTRPELIKFIDTANESIRKLQAEIEIARLMMRKAKES